MLAAHGFNNHVVLWCGGLCASRCPTKS
jgi:hypothetical protein